MPSFVKKYLLLPYFVLWSFTVLLVMEFFHPAPWDSNDKGHGGHVGVSNKRR